MVRILLSKSNKCGGGKEMTSNRGKNITLLRKYLEIEFIIDEEDFRYFDEEAVFDEFEEILNKEGATNVKFIFLKKEGSAVITEACKEKKKR